MCFVSYAQNIGSPELKRQFISLYLLHLINVAEVLMQIQKLWVNILILLCTCLVKRKTNFQSPKHLTVFKIASPLMNFLVISFNISTF